MDLERIKKLIKQNGDKFVLVENDTPEIVMMSFGEYEKLTEAFPLFQKPKLVVRALDTERPEETEFVIPLGSSSESRPVKPVHLEDISLEDLPL